MNTEWVFENMRAIDRCEPENFCDVDFRHIGSGPELPGPALF